MFFPIVMANDGQYNENSAVWFEYYYQRNIISYNIIQLNWCLKMIN